MFAYGLAPFDLRVALLKMLDNRISDLMLLIFGYRSSHPADQAEPFPPRNQDGQPKVIDLNPLLSRKLTGLFALPPRRVGQSRVGPGC